LSTQNEEATSTSTQDFYISYKSSNIASQKSMLSQDINPVPKRKSDVLDFFKKLSEDKVYSSSYASSSLNSQDSSDRSLSQNELSSQTTNSSLDDLDPLWVEAIVSNKDTNEDTVLNHIEQKIEGESMASNYNNQETGDTYTKFKEQTKGTFLKIMEAMYPKVDECVESDKDKNIETQKKRSIEDVQETSSNVENLSSKVTVLNNRDIVKIPNPNSLSNLCFSRSVMFLSSPIYNKYGKLWYGLPKVRKYQ
jgi:phosphopantetheine adenylyltransferase